MKSLAQLETNPKRADEVKPENDVNTTAQLQMTQEQAQALVLSSLVLRTQSLCFAPVIDGIICARRPSVRGDHPIAHRTTMKAVTRKFIWKHRNIIRGENPLVATG